MNKQGLKQLEAVRVQGILALSRSNRDFLSSVSSYFSCEMGFDCPMEGSHGVGTMAAFDHNVGPQIEDESCETFYLS
ncbi:hypothetical protein SLA2020_228640 [Shorea laevis]